MRSDLAWLRPARVAVAVWIVLSAIFWGNLFRFHPAMIDRSYDDTSEMLVIGRMARAAVDGIFNHTDLGQNADPQHPTSIGEETYNSQVRVYEHPDLIHSVPLEWGLYPSHFALQGFVFAILDRIDPLPRHFRISFYHLLASLFTAGVLVWIATILRARFGWAAFAGFLFPVAIEPMFSALAPSLYWIVGIWFVPMALAMLLADEDDPPRRRMLLAFTFLGFFAKFLCGYEFTSTIILMAAMGCLLGISERRDPFRRIFSDVCWVIGIGVAAFVAAAVAHALKEGGFAIFLEKAANRMIGNAPTLQEQLLLGNFATIGSVLWTYLGGNFITLIKNFGYVLALPAAYALLILLDEKFNWFYGAGRRKLQILALAVLVSFSAPLSWLVLAKAHSFAHPPIDLIVWYMPTIPLGFAMLAVACVSFRQYQALHRGDALRSWLVALVPLVLILAVLGIQLIDRRIATTGTWVITEHANAVPVFDSEPLGIEFNISNQWFTVRYPCPISPEDSTFVIRARQGDATVAYDFPMNGNQVFSRKGTCIAAKAKSDWPVSQIHFGVVSKQGPIWERDATISLPGSFRPQPLTNSDWDRGISRASGREVLVTDGEFGRLLIKAGDEVEIAPGDKRTIVSIASAGNSKVITLDGAPIRLPAGQEPAFGIVRH